MLLLLFLQQKKGEEEKRQKNGEMVGSGRVIPIKQGYLYKKSAKPLSKDWKKKYVTLLDDGRLTYHPSLHVRVLFVCLFDCFRVQIYGGTGSEHQHLNILCFTLT